MSNDELQARYDLLTKYVVRMRTYQMKYYKYRAVQDKENMVKYQRQVDKLLADDVKVKESNQLKML